MNKHGLTKENLMEALPLALREDPSVVALAEALATVLADRPAEIDRLRIYPAIETLDEPLLDILAYDFKVDWWDPEYTLEEKRRTLKDSWRVHKLLGTKAAVVMAISAIYPRTQVLEWWEYGGEPFCFRLLINAAGVRTDAEKHSRVLERVNYYKSMRSHMDGFIWDFTDKPFIERTGHLFFHCFTMGWAFSNRRSFPPLRLDGSVPLDGSAMLDAVPRSMFAFPRFTVGGTMPGVRDEVERIGIRYGLAPFAEGGRVDMPEFRARLPTPGNRQGPAAFSALRVSGGLKKNRESVSRAALTVDTMYTLDGAVLLDGARKLNAEIRQEEL